MGRKDDAAAERHEHTQQQRRFFTVKFSGNRRIRMVGFGVDGGTVVGFDMSFGMIFFGGFDGADMFNNV